MSERNVKLLRKWARATGQDIEHPHYDHMWRMWKKTALRKLLLTQLHELGVRKPRMRWQLRDFNATPSRSVRKRLGL